MLVNDHAVGNVQHRLHGKELPFSHDIAVLDVRLPHMVDGDDFRVTADASDRWAASSTLGKQDSHVFAEAVHPLLIDHQPVLPPKSVSQLVISVGIPVATNGRPQRVLNGIAAHSPTIVRQHVSRTEEAALTRQPFQSVLRDCFRRSYSRSTSRIRTKSALSSAA